MAMEIYTLSDRRLNSMADWQRAIDAEGFPFPLLLSTETPFARLTGFLPARYENTQSGFECDHWDSRSIMAEYPGTVFGHQWKFALAFRFGGRLGELEAAWMAATACARALRGVVFDTEEGRVFQPNDAANLKIIVRAELRWTRQLDESFFLRRSRNSENCPCCGGLNR